jgi:type IV secretion system protein TrbJ
MSTGFLRRVALGGATALALGLAPSPAHPIIVFDPSNYAQNILTAAHTLEQINNQIKSLQNEAQMLINQARNLENLPYSALQSIEQSFQKTQALLSQAQGLAYNVQRIETEFQQHYPLGYSGSTSSQQMIGDAETRWKNSISAFEDALKVQAGVVQGLDTTRTEANALVSSSQSATGALEATQAGNQLMALQAKQLADLTALIASQSRAQSLESARTTANQAQAQEQLKRFLTTGKGYQAQPVQMFHQ